MSKMGEREANLLMGETSISLSLTSIMTMVSFLFIALLLTREEGIQNSLKIPLLYFFISGFAFLYSTIIYANVSGNLARLQENIAHQQLCHGNVISEFFGIYFVIYAMPLVLNGFIDDIFFNFTILLINIIGFVFYHYLGYSILERYLAKREDLYFILLLICSLMVINFLSMNNIIDFEPLISAILLLTTTIFLGVYCLNLKE